MFLSFHVFRKNLRELNKVVLELYDTDGAQGALRRGGWNWGWCICFLLLKH